MGDTTGQNPRWPLNEPGIRADQARMISTGGARTPAPVHTSVGVGGKDRPIGDAGRGRVRSGGKPPQGGMKSITPNESGQVGPGQGGGDDPIASLFNLLKDKYGKGLDSANRGFLGDLKGADLNNIYGIDSAGWYDDQGSITEQGKQGWGVFDASKASPSTSAEDAMEIMNPKPKKRKRGGRKPFKNPKQKPVVEEEEEE